MINILIYGINGYIGNILKQYFKKCNNINIILSNYDKLLNSEQLIDDITQLKPDRIISTIGLTHSAHSNSTIILNDNKYLPKNIEKNLYIHCLISNICIKYNIHYTYIGTGCIYSSNTNKVFDESDEPNYSNSNYGVMKSFTDKLLALDKDKNLIIRIRQCINNDTHPRNFLNKFLSYDAVSDIPNSFTIIPSIFPIITDLIINKHVGIFNCVNKNSISIKEIMTIFDKPNVSILDKEISNSYANNILSIKNLEKYYDIEDVRTALINLKNNM